MGDSRTSKKEVLVAHVAGGGVLSSTSDVFFLRFRCWLARVALVVVIVVVVLDVGGDGGVSKNRGRMPPWLRLPELETCEVSPSSSSSSSSSLSRRVVVVAVVGDCCVSTLVWGGLTSLSPRLSISVYQRS